MTPAEILLAIGAVITATVAYLNYRNTARKDVVALLQGEVTRLSERLAASDKEHEEEIARRDTERKRLRNRVRFLHKLALAREQENNRLLAKIDQWYTWSKEMGRAYNLLYLELSAIKHQLDPSLPEDDPQSTLPVGPGALKGTGPLPPPPPGPFEREEPT